MIPQDITIEHIRGAIRRVRREGVPGRRRSRGYCLIDHDCHFPPKYIISLAYEIVSGRTLRSDEFVGGQQSNDFLRSRGFCVSECDCHGILRETEARRLVVDGPRRLRRGRHTQQISCPQAEGRSAAAREALQPSNRSANDRKIKNRLLEFSESIDPRELVPTAVPEAASFVSDPFAFLLACSLDRGVKAEVAWTIPYDLEQALGHLDPHLLHEMSAGDLDRVIQTLPRKPRYGRAARTVKDLAAIVVKECGGDAKRMWQGRTACELHDKMRQIYGVGPGIASMVALLLERVYRLRFGDLDRRSIDIKPDVHTKRVLYRLGAAAGRDNDVAVAAARRLNPEYPGALDSALWIVGRRWCREHTPDCKSCELAAVCEQVGVR